jgi:L-lactate utilization protein LutC
MLSPSIIILLNIFGLVLTNPVKQTATNEKSGNISIHQAFRNAEKILNRYYYLMDSDSDHLVHGMLHVLMNNPTSFRHIPYRAMNIALKNVERKLGHDSVEALTKPLLLALEQNYLTNSKKPSTVKLTDETKDKIEEELDKFLDEAENDDHL